MTATELRDVVCSQEKGISTAPELTADSHSSSLQGIPLMISGLSDLGWHRILISIADGDERDMQEGAGEDGGALAREGRAAGELISIKRAGIFD